MFHSFSSFLIFPLPLLSPFSPSSLPLPPIPLLLLLPSPPSYPPSPSLLFPSLFFPGLYGIQNILPRLPYGQNNLGIAEQTNVALLCALMELTLNNYENAR